MISNLRLYQEILDETGLPFEIVNGSKHRKVMLAGKLVTVISSNGRASNNDAIKWFRSKINRAVREYGEAK